MHLYLSYIGTCISEEFQIHGVEFLAKDECNFFFKHYLFLAI